MIVEWFLFMLTFLIGFYLGGKGKAITEDVKEQINAIISPKPKPGVVRQLTPEELADKRDPIKQGNKSAFDKFFRNNPKP